MNTTESGIYKYYAFISYSRKDQKWAKWLQNRLETYRLPSKIRKENSDIPKRIVPIFRDKTDLSGVILEESIRKELDASKFLIVICSTNSKNSVWVNKEIEYFKSLGKADRIIPLMLEPSLDCFPEEISNITPALLGVSLKQEGKRHAFLQIVSTLLGLRYDDLAKRDKKRSIKRNSILSIMVAMLMIVGSYSIYYNTPHSKYYNDVVYKYELPVGIYEISKEVAKNKACSYKITTKRRKIVSVEKINPYGKITDSPVYLSTTQYPVQFFSYDDDGQLISIEYANKNNEIVLEKELSYNSSGDEISIEFKNSANNTKAQGLLSDLSYLNIPLESGGKSEITQQLNTYDDNGNLINAVFHRDNLETPTCDSNGVYGKLYEYNGFGQAVLITNLNADGEPFDCKYGWAKVAYEYDAKGNCVLEQYLDKENNKVRINTGISAINMAYDDNCNIVSFSYSDENGYPCEDSTGISELVCTYEKDGLMANYKYIDKDGELTVDSDGIHETRIEYNEDGAQTKISFYNISGEAMFSSAYGCCQYVMKPDSYGRIEEAWFCDGEGSLMCDENSGACGNRFVYDENGYLNEVHYLDSDRKNIITQSGYSSFVITRNSLGQILKEETFDTANKLVCSNNGYAVAEYEYDSFGNITKVSYFDENGIACNCIGGYSILKYEYERSNPVKIYCYDADGNPTLCNDNYHLVYMVYENGNCVHTSYYDTEINFINTTDGYAIYECDYDELGNVVTDAWYDEYQIPVSAPDYYLITHTYDKFGNDVETQYYTSDSAIPKVTVKTQYDSYGNALLQHYYDGEGNLYMVK